MRILTIIVSYNFEPWMERCLGSLRQSIHPVDVLVIDNDSQDHTVELIERNYPEVRILCNSKNLGFGGANNIGLQLALIEDYDAVFLLNQDAWIDKNTIGILGSLCQKEPQYGIFSPIHLTGAGDKSDHGFAIYTGINNIDDIEKEKEEVVSVPFINAAFWMIPTLVLKKIGGFCPLFYHYGEDKDYINRIHYHGYQIGYSPTALGWHDRDNRVSNRESDLRSEHIYLLTEFSNINYSFTKAIRRSIKASIKTSYKLLRGGNKKDSAFYIGVAFQLCKRIWEIAEFRKKNSKQGPNYIAASAFERP